MEEKKFINKFRPENLDEIIGHKSVIKAIKKSIAKEELDHSILLYGYFGIGKTTLARIIAKETKAIEKNIIEIDSGANNGVEFVKELVENLKHPAFGGNNTKVVIIDEIQNLASDKAWTSLFKIMEEPPKHLYFILCTSEFSRVPEAIKRRCSKFYLKSIDTDTMIEYIKTICKKEDIDLEEDSIDLIVNKSNGSIGVALGYLSTVRYATTEKEVEELLEEVVSNEQVGNLCKVLANPDKYNYTKAKYIIKDLKGLNPESIRIQIINYITACLLNSKGKEELKFLSILQSFINPFPYQTGFANLLLAVADVFYEKE